MLSLILIATAAGEAVAEEHNPILPEIPELIWGSIAFAIVFVVLWKFAFPQINTMLAARAEKIQGQMEEAEATRTDADKLLADYREQLANAREEANRIIEEARSAAEQMRKDLNTKAEREAQGIVDRANEEIRSERDRVFAELKAQVADIAVELAGRVVGQSLDKSAHEKLIDDYIAEVSRSSNGNGGGN
ncbi:MAG: F0F1 ATP synthase subunit B [Actinomycetota bacterium]